MFRKDWLHRVGSLLVVAGLVLSPSASVFAQDQEVDAAAIVTIEGEPDPTNGPAGDAVVAEDEVSADEVETEDVVAAYVDGLNNRVFLPLVQSGADPTVNAAGPIILPIPDFCKTQAANATRTMGAHVQSVTSSSRGGSYFKPNTIRCNRWIVDIFVPSNSSGSQFSTPAFYISSNPLYLLAPFPSTKPKCEAYREYISIYRKSMFQTGFMLVESARFKGVWTEYDPDDWDPFPPPPCVMQALPGSKILAQPLKPPTFGTTVYRVATAVSFGGIWQTATVEAWHHEEPN